MRIMYFILILLVQCAWTPLLHSSSPNDIACGESAHEAHRTTHPQKTFNLSDKDDLTEIVHLMPKGTAHFLLICSCTNQNDVQHTSHKLLLQERYPNCIKGRHCIYDPHTPEPPEKEAKNTENFIREKLYAKCPVILILPTSAPLPGLHSFNKVVLSIKSQSTQPTRCLLLLNLASHTVFDVC